MSLHSDCLKFCILYNRKNQFQIKENDFKNENFIKFYLEICKHLELNEKKIKNLRKLLCISIFNVHKWDDLIDKKHISIKQAKEMVFRHYNKISKKEFPLVKKLNIDLEKYIKIVENDLDIIEKYFQWEKKIVKTKPTRERIISILKKGNCDFYLYNHVASLFLKKEGAKQINSFIREYLVLDLLLDHIADLEDDIKENSFNIILWALNYENMKISSPKLYDKIVEAGIFELLYDIGIEFGRRAKDKLKCIQNNKLRNLLGTFIQGEIDGLELFKKHHYLSSTLPSLRYKIKKLILKPHPWELLSFEEVFGKIKNL